MVLQLHKKELTKQFTMYVSLVKRRIVNILCLHVNPKTRFSL